MDTGGSSSEQFELVFEGLDDKSEDTLRKVKGIFLAELDLSASQAMEILQNVPSTIATSSNEEDLSKQYKALKGAGCKVLLVRPTGSNDNGVEERSMAVDYDFSGALESIDRAKEEARKEMQEYEEALVEYESNADDGEVLEFSLDLDELAEESAVAAEKSGNVPTYSLDMDEDVDSLAVNDEIEDLIKSIDQPPVVDALNEPDQVMSSVEEVSAGNPAETPQAEASGSWDLNIDLDTSPVVEELVETTASVAEQAESTAAAEVVQEDEFDLTINLGDDLAPAEGMAPEEVPTETDQQIADLASELSVSQVAEAQIPAGIIKTAEDSSASEPEAPKITSDDLAADLIPDAPLFSFDDKEPEAVPEVKKVKPVAEPMPDLSLSFDDEPEVAEVTIESAPSAPVEAPEEVLFSFDDDAASTEKNVAPSKEPQAPVALDSGLSLDDVADEIVIEPANATPEVVAESSTMSLTTEEADTPQLSTADEGRAANQSTVEDDEPPTSLPPLATVSKKKAKVAPKKIEPEEQEDEEGSVEVAAEEEEVNFEEPARAKKGKRLPIDMICAVVIGVALLGYYHLVKQPEPQTRGVQISPEAIQATLQRQRSEAQAPVAKTKPAAKVDPADSLPEVTHSGEFGNEQLSYAWKLTVRGNKPLHLVLEGTTPEPPELTPEQVVRQESRAPWIEKFETDRIRFIPGDDNVSTGSGISKFYIEHDSGRNRVIGRVHVTAQRSENEVSLDFTMWAGTEEMPITDEDFLLETIDTPGVPFRTYLTGTMLQSTVVEESAPEGEEVAANAEPVKESKDSK